MTKNAKRNKPIHLKSYYPPLQGHMDLLVNSYTAVRFSSQSFNICHSPVVPKFMCSMIIERNSPFHAREHCCFGEHDSNQVQRPFNKQHQSDNGLEFCAPERGTHERICGIMPCFSPRSQCSPWDSRKFRMSQATPARQAAPTRAPPLTQHAYRMRRCSLRALS